MGKKSPFEDAIEQQLPGILPYIGLRIDAVEVTQAIQYSRAAEHLTDPADRGPDNSVPLVAEKPAWVRVYVHSALGFPIIDVTGELTVYVRKFGYLWEPVVDLSPQPPGWITAEWDPDYALQRSTLEASLNFVVPAEVMCGHLRLDVDVEAPAAGYKVSTSTHIEATLQQTLSVRVIPVAYDGPDASGSGSLQLPAPDLADAQSTAAWSLLVYPVCSTPVVVPLASVTLTEPLSGVPAPGDCTVGFKDLNVKLAAVKTANGNLPDTVYYGLVPADVPHGTNIGCETLGVSSGFVNLGTTMAHEIGHGLGFGHVAGCNNPGAVDPAYPIYEPYPQGSIGEYGLDINAGFVHSPVTGKAFMTYCDASVRWISLYHHHKSINNAVLAPTYVCQDEPWWPNEKAYDPFWWIHPPEPPVEPLVSIIGVRHLTGELDVRSVTRTIANPSVLGGVRSELMAELLDAAGQRAAAAPVYRFQAQGSCGCCDRDGGGDGSWIFQAFVPDVATGSTLRLLDADGEQRWVRQAPSRPPVIETFGARIHDGRLEVEWQLRRDDDACEVWLRRVGETLNGVIHVSRGTGQARLDLGLLPLGNVSLELAVHDGFHITTSEAVDVEVPGRPPTVALFHPRDQQILRAGGTLRLHGIATSADGKPVDPPHCHWQIDGVSIAAGIDAWVVAPTPGEHHATLVATDQFGQSQRTATFQTVQTASHRPGPDGRSGPTRN